MSESIEYLNAIITSINEIIFHISSDYRIINVWVRDPSKLFMPPVEFLGKTLREVFGSDFSIPFEESITDSLKNNKTNNLTYPSYLNNKEQWWNGRITPILLDGENTGNVSIIISEITDKIKTERMLKNETNFLNNIIDFNPMSIQITDENGYTIKVNKAHTKLFGSVPPPEYSIFNDLLLQKLGLQEEMRKVKQTKEIIHFPVIKYNTRELGEQFPDNPVWIKMIVFPILNEKNEIESIVLMHEDVTKQKNFEENLKKSEERLRMALNSVNDGLWDWNLETNDVYFNPKYYTMLGFEVDEFPGSFEHWKALVHADDFPLTEIKIREHVEGKSEIYESEFRLRCKDGSWRWILARGKIIECDSNGKPIRFIGTHTDITKIKLAEEEIKRTKEEAEKASKAKSMFLANMSHELRTPLNGIVGLTEILGMTGMNDEQTQYIKDIDKCSLSLLEIINDILDISKIEAGKVEVQKSTFNLEKMIDNISNIFFMDFYRKGLEFGYYIDPEIPDLLTGDEGKIRQILINLINNSKKFTEKGHIYLEIKVISRFSNTLKLQFTVEDTGIGISYSIRDKLFSPFEQGDMSYAKKYQGAGLGLAISKKLIELMNGSIWFESEIGSGTKFYFTLDVNYDLSLKSDIEKINIDLSKINILVVDDNELNRFITEKLLRDFKMNITLADNGYTGLNILRSGESFDLVLLDVNMPELSGLDVFKTMKSESLNTPVILFSSIDITNKLDSLKEIGIKNYIIKPVKKKELVEKIIETLRLVNEEKRIIESANESNRKKESMAKILLVEDNEMNTKTISIVLEFAGYTVFKVQNGKEALDFLKTNNVDLILMDLQMPILDGLETTKIIRENESITGQHMPIIALTAYARKEDEEISLKSGMDDFIAKPVRKDILYEKIIKNLKKD